MEALLRKGLAQLGLDDSGAPSLLRYGELLLEKNKVMNLTAITEPQDVATLHFLDSAALLTLADLKGKSVVDVGTGAGLPGMPLKILEPSIRMTLLDSLGKRITFLQEVCDDLGLTDVQCIHARAEEFAADHRQSFDFAVSRAVANLSVLCELCLPLVKVGGAFLSMKSVESDGELEQAKKAIGILGGRVERTADYSIPGTDVTHRVIFIKKNCRNAKKISQTICKNQKESVIIGAGRKWCRERTMYCCCVRQGRHRENLPDRRRRHGAGPQRQARAVRGLRHRPAESGPRSGTD